ncbi:phage major capsid protein [Bacillus sp. UMB0899]|uniref:SU10 major capsid protein n=1 Tax=Metabacillus sp. YM-086 TaxID=3341729 RepID=UPI000C80F2E9|nr:phage major capsid protein [Bacillus sp. UMB0899]
MFTSDNFTKTEQISLSKEIAIIGVQATPFTSMLMAKGNIEKALSTVYTWREKTLDNEEDLSALEGEDTTVFYESARAELNNILEIFKKGASLSGTAIAMKRNQLAEEVNDRLLELKINMEKKFINGLKADGSATPFKRQLSGLIEMADPTNAVSVTGSITEEKVKEVMRNLWNQDLAEGTVYAFLNADLKEQVDNIYKEKYGYNHVTTSFGLLVESINTNYGKVNFVLSKHVPADKIVVFNDAYVDLVYLREPHFEPLAKTGDSVKGHVIAESTLKVGSKKAVAVVTVTA